MKKIFALVATASLLFSCSQEVAPEFEKLPINISVGQQTRANDSTYENEDEVGIYVVNYDGSTAGTLAASGNQADNERFTYNNGAWTPDETIYWKDHSTAADFYAYYPYSESVNISAHPFSVMADQSTEDNFWASDFLWGKATKVTPTSAAVPIVTNHSLSKILLAIEPGNGFTEESWTAATKSVKICNVKTNATIDLASGVATATGDDGEIVPFLSVPTTPGVNPSYKAMIVPQTIADNSKLIVVTVDGTEYVYRTGITFKANTQHRFVVTVNKKGGNVDVTIGEWDMDDFVNIGNAEEEEEIIENIIPNNQISYTATAKVEPYRTDVFGANIESNEWDSTTGNGIITFDGDVTTIGKWAFRSDDYLTSITIPNSVTSIEDEAFYYCETLSDIILSKRLETIKTRAFQGCQGLTKIDFPNSLTSIGSSAFSGAGLQTIIIPDNVSQLGDEAFYGCAAAKQLTVGNGIKAIGDSVFTACGQLLSIEGSFAKDDGNTLIINDMFIFMIRNCSTTNYSIPDNVTEIKPYAFWGCNISEITIPNSVNKIGHNCWSWCSNLTTVYCKALTPPVANYTTSWTAFYNRSILTIYVPRESVDAYKSAAGWSEYADCIAGYDF